jgi:hypothetical protein
LQVKLDYAHLVPTFADDDPEHKNPPIKREMVEVNKDDVEEKLEVSFGEFSETVHTFTIPAVPGASRVYYEVLVLLPETETLAGGKGIWVSNSGNQKIELQAPIAETVVEATRAEVGTQVAAEIAAGAPEAGDN